MAFLDDLRARVERSRGDDLAYAAALVELAELEPVLGNRTVPVRAAIDAAALVLDRVGSPELRARLLLRLASVKLVEQDLEGADQALAGVGDHVPDHTAMRFLTGVRACRVALRRGPGPRKTANDMLLAAAARLPSFDASDVIWQQVTSEIILGVAEVAIHGDPPDDGAFEPLRQLVDELATARSAASSSLGDAPHTDVVFTGKQLLVAYAFSIGDRAKAIAGLRAMIKLAETYRSPADEVEARLALAGVLVDGTEDRVSREEAAHHVQRARDRSLEHHLGSLHQAALIAQAGVLSAGGKTAGAIDRMLELAESAANDQDIPRYVSAVAIMAELYAKSGDVVSAYRTIVESHHALSRATKTDTTSLFRPHLAALRDRIGSDRLEQVAADVQKANQLADELADRTSNDPG